LPSSLQQAQHETNTALVMDTTVANHVQQVEDSTTAHGAKMSGHLLQLSLLLTQQQEQQQAVHTLFHNHTTRVQTTMAQYMDNQVHTAVHQLEVRENCMVHVGCTRCVTWGVDFTRL
jgi:hypothetical protein